LVQLQELQRRLGRRVRELRRKRGWTQDVFADKSGFHRAQVGAFERGEMNLTLASVYLLAQTLQIKVVELFKGVED
jgi:transcriptional regulator with XRE-family HTH domain